MNILFHIKKEVTDIPTEAKYVILGESNELISASNNLKYAEGHLIYPENILYKRVNIYYPNKKEPLTCWINSDILEDSEFKMLMYATRGRLFYDLKNTIKQLARKISQYNKLFKAFEVLTTQFKKLSAKYNTLKRG